MVKSTTIKTKKTSRLPKIKLERIKIEHENNNSNSEFISIDAEDTKQIIIKTEVLDHEVEDTFMPIVKSEPSSTIDSDDNDSKLTNSPPQSPPQIDEDSLDIILSEFDEESSSSVEDNEDEDYQEEEEEEENINVDDDDDLPKKSFEVNGMTIETVGDYSKCPKCLKRIKSTFIIRHIKLHDTPHLDYPCPEPGCNLISTRINNLIRHLSKIHRSKIPYICKYKNCGKRFSKPKELRCHHVTHRKAASRWDDDDSYRDGPEMSYKCEFPGCDKEYKKKHHLKEHERKHTGDRRFSCEVCGKKFFVQSHLKRHVYSHTGIKPHECRWKCGAIFASYGGRMKHERINHYEENPLQSECDICGRPFKNTQQLTKHRMTHMNPSERRDFRCAYCGIMFDTVKLRERHEERHKDGEVFECEICKRVFKNDKNLNHHIKVHHTEKPKEDDPNDTKDIVAQNKKIKNKNKSEPPKHPCHICEDQSRLYCLTTLRRHLARIHSTNFKCSREGCKKTFREQIQLENHMETHRTRECHICGKQFQRKQNADIHLIGVHGLSKEDLMNLGRWRPRKKDLGGDRPPEYMTRKGWGKKKSKKVSMKKPMDEDNEEDNEEEEHIFVDTDITIKAEPFDLDDDTPYSTSQ